MDTTTPIYNGYSVRQILANLPDGMTRNEKRRYIYNCIEVYRNEIADTNLGYNDKIRYSNFLLIKSITETN